MNSHTPFLPFRVLLIALLFFAQNTFAQEELKIQYGGVLKLAVNAPLQNLFPPAAFELQDQQVILQTYERLVEFDYTSLQTKPLLAKSYEVSEDRLTYRFYLRQDVLFHDDECFESESGKRLTARDVKYCFEFLCSKSSLNAYDWMFEEVKGAKAFAEAKQYNDPSITEVSGIQVIDQFTLEIQLEQPVVDFLERLALPAASIYSAEAAGYYGTALKKNIVGTGPFMQTSNGFNPMILERNEDYWDTSPYGDPLPYLDQVEFHHFKKFAPLVDALAAGEIHAVNPKVSTLDFFMEYDQLSPDLSNCKVLSTPQLFTAYYGFNHQLKPFDDPLVRQAFNYAINREQLINTVFQGRASPATKGVVCPATPQYDRNKVSGYTFDPTLAQEKLAEAGYPNGENFPEVALTVNPGIGGINTKVALQVQAMLKEVLNIEISIELVPFDECLTMVEEGRSAFWRDGWTVDLPGAYNFLFLYDSDEIPTNPSEPSLINTYRYQSDDFDQFLQEAEVASNLKTMNEVLLRAEQQLMRDAAVLTLWHLHSYLIINKNVEGVSPTPMNHLMFKYAFVTP